MPFSKIILDCITVDRGLSNQGYPLAMAEAVRQKGSIHPSGINPSISFIF